GPGRLPRGHAETSIVEVRQTTVRWLLWFQIGGPFQAAVVVGDFLQTLLPSLTGRRTILRSAAEPVSRVNHAGSGSRCTRSSTTARGTASACSFSTLGSTSSGRGCTDAAARPTHLLSCRDDAGRRDPVAGAAGLGRLCRP